MRRSTVVAGVAGRVAAGVAGRVAAGVAAAAVVLALAGVARAQPVAPDDGPAPDVAPQQYSPPPAPPANAAPQQYSPPQYPPTNAAPQQYPPPRYAPPPGYQLIPALSTEELRAEESRLRGKKVTGAVLLSLGAVSAVIGQALVIAYYAEGTTVHCTFVGQQSICNSDEHREFLYAALGLDLAGAILLGVGVPIFTSASSQLRRVRALIQGQQLYVAPAVSMNGAGLKLGFRF